MCELIARVKNQYSATIILSDTFLAAGWNYSTPMILGPNSESLFRLCLFLEGIHVHS